MILNVLVFQDGLSGDLHHPPEVRLLPQPLHLCLFVINPAVLVLQVWLRVVVLRTAGLHGFQ